jgi:calcium-dependent protein kinase
MLAWDKISNDAKDLIKNMLCDHKSRFSASDVLNHTWVKNKAPNADHFLTELNVESLKCYKNNNKLKKAVLTFIASRLKDDEIKILKDIFNTLDKDKNGTLTLEEVREGIFVLKKVFQN